MTIKLEDIVYPECSMRPERFSSSLEAVDCANKTSRLGAGLLISLVIVGVLIYIYNGHEVTGMVWLVIMGSIAIGAGMYLTSGFLAERNWMANNTKINQIMTMNPALNRTQAAETVIRENMQQEQYEIANRSANAQERTSNALLLNTGLNAFNTFNRN